MYKKPLLLDTLVPLRDHQDFCILPPQTWQITSPANSASTSIPLILDVDLAAYVSHSTTKIELFPNVCDSEFRDLQIRSCETHAHEP